MLPVHWRAFVSGTIVLVAAGLASAQLTTSSHLTNTVAGVETDLDLPTSGQLPLDYSRSGTSDFPSLMAVGQAETGGGAVAKAHAEVEVTTVVTDPTVQNGQFMAGTSAFITTHTTINQTRPNPLGYQPPLFLTARISGEATVSGDLTGGGSGTGNCAANLSRQGGGLIGSGSASANSTNPTAQFDKTFAFSLTLIDAPIILVSNVSASAQGATPVAGGHVDVNVTADPVFSFDQASFDQYAAANGFATFNLSDYYGFQYSPGTDVPEPTVGGLVLGGIVVGTMKRSRRLPSV